MPDARCVRIPLSNTELCAIVAPDDVELVSGRRWYAGWTSAGSVAAVMAKVRGRTVLMHRLIMAASTDSLVDHINGDPLDNRKPNLRLCTHAENMRNRRIHRNNQSGFKGVHAATDRKAVRWRAQISVDNKRIHLGSYATAEAAHAAYVEAAAKYHGAFARTA